MNLTIFIHKYLTPRHLLTRLVGKLASSELKSFTTFIIKQFVKFKKIDMDQALYPIEHYKTFNDFFIRELKAEARPLGQADIVSPADGKITQFGTISNGNLIQAKGQDYTTRELLAISKEEAQKFNGGSYFTVYLSPRDYHRVHMSCRGKLIKTIFVPGDLYSVNDNAISNIEALYARNERLICYFETEYGLMAHIMVGATITGSIFTSWTNGVESLHSTRIVEKDYSDKNIMLEKGDYVGAFLMGSTTVTLFEKPIDFNTTNIKENQPILVKTDVSTVKNSEAAQDTAE